MLWHYVGHDNLNKINNSKKNIVIVLDALSADVLRIMEVHKLLLILIQNIMHQFIKILEQYIHILHISLNFFTLGHQMLIVFQIHCNKKLSLKK